MEVENIEEEKKKKDSILKKLERYVRRSKSSLSSSRSSRRSIFTKSRSWHSSSAKEKRKSGFFSVYVGAEKQRFLIKTEFANHPLFKMLLEDAELEYGFKNEGPLTLPCEVDLFCKVLAEMDGGDQKFDDQYLCGSGSCSPFMTPTRRLGGGCSSYVLLTPPRSLKINQF